MDALRDVYLNNLTFDGQAILIPLRSMETGLLEDRYFNFIYQPKYDYQGKVEGIMVFAFEVTKMISVEKDLAKAKETLNSAIRAAELGIFDYDLQKDLLEGNEKCRLIFGINHHGPISYEKDFLARIHPDDLKEVLNQIRRSGLQSENHDNLDVEFRILLDEDGEIKWIKTWGKFYFDQNERLLRFIGALMEITEPKTN